MDVQTRGGHEPPHEARAECGECGAHARVLVSPWARVGFCSVCGSDRLTEIAANSADTVVTGRFRQAV